MATISSIGAAQWNVFFAPKAATTGTTVSGFYFDNWFVNDLHKHKRPVFSGAYLKM